MKKALLTLILIFSCFSAWSTELLNFIWIGGVTDSRAVVMVKAKTIGSLVNVKLHTDPSFDPTLGMALVETSTSMDADLTAKLTLSGLLPDTIYYYWVFVDGNLDTVLNDADNGIASYTGQFKTFPTPGTPSNFSFAFHSCIANTSLTAGPNHALFNTVKNQSPLFYLNTGDFFYADIATNNPPLFRTWYEGRFRYNNNAPTQLASLLRTTSAVYMWDDHDFGPDESYGIIYQTDGSKIPTTHKPAAHLVYRQYVPHYPLALAGDAAYPAGQEPIAQAFSVGRVRILMTDLRSEKPLLTDPNLPSEGKSLLGPTQKAWFKNELLAANGVYPLIVWVSSVPWGGAPAVKSNLWNGFHLERTEIANFVKDNGITGLCILAGDMHGVAIDTGINSDFATNGGAKIPVFQAASVGRSSSYKGGPYDRGSNPIVGKTTRYLNNFGWFSVTDDGKEVNVAWTAQYYDGTTIPGQKADGSYTAPPIQWSFTQANPVIVALSPVAGATHVAPNIPLEITFNKEIRFGTGNVIIYRSSDDAAIATFDVSNGSISNNHLTLVPPSSLSTGEYYVTLAKGAVLDLFGNPFAGISSPFGLSYKKWNFTVQVPNVPPLITTQPGSITVAYNTSTTLSVVASGIDLSYQWYQGISGDTSIPVSGAVSATWTTPLLSVTTPYWVQVSHAEGSVYSNTATVTVKNRVSISPYDNKAAEPNAVPAYRTGKFRFMRTGNTTESLSISYTLSGTASSGSDYQTLNTVAFIPAGANFVDVTVTPLTDALDEEIETVSATISEDLSYLIDSAKAAAIISIYDADYGTPTVSVNIVDAEALEPNAAANQGKARFWVARTGSLHAALTVKYVMSGTATSGSDYMTLTGTTTIAVGKTYAEVVLTALTDNLDEDNEMVVATLITEPSYTIEPTKFSAQVTIYDAEYGPPTVSLFAYDALASEPSSVYSEGAGSFRFTRTGSLYAPLTVKYAITGTATSGSDYSLLSGTATMAVNASHTNVVVIAKMDSLTEGTETVVLLTIPDTSYIVDSTKATATVTIYDLQ